MSFATPAMGSNNQELERRIADLERKLGEFDRVWVTVGIPGGGGARQQMEVIARRGSPEEGTASHQWQPTQASSTTIDMKGGVLTSQAGFAEIEVADVAGLSAAASGFVILTLSRNSSTRAVEGTPVISFVAGMLPASDRYGEIIPLAKVTVVSAAITEILPLQFQRLHIFEDLVVANGEFQLASLLMAAPNIYDLPP